MILYRIVRSPLEVLGEVSPLVAHILVEDEENPLLIFGPLFLIDVGVEMIMPSFPALFADATLDREGCTWHVFSDDSPLLGTVLGDKFDEVLILFLSPCFFAPWMSSILHLDAS
jgi:hypothetical protein